MTVCEHCTYRNSWDCDDGWNRRKGGCNEFKLDWSTLTGKQQNTVRRILAIEEYESDNEWVFDYD